MPMVQREDWEELIQILQKVEERMPSSTGNFGSDQVEDICRDLRGFHATAAMLEMKELEGIALSLEDYLKQGAASEGDQESVQIVGFALRTLLEEMEHAANNGTEGINLAEIREILESAETGGEGAAAELAAEEDLPDISRLRQLVENLGGEVSLEAESPNGAGLQLRFEATPQMVEQMENLLVPKDPASLLNDAFPDVGDRLDRVLGTIREFMQAMSSGDMKSAQEILLDLAEQRDQAGLYNEIGLMARELHNSLKHFMDTLDPALKEIVESKLPDSGNRLEHILELTEKAANTTLDHVETMQKRNQEDQIGLAELQQLLGDLQAIGEQAQEKLGKGVEIFERLNASLLQTHEDLIVVLTAQDYQDLTGQIIMKIMNLLKDLELKLVNVIRAFGVKTEFAALESKEELYGPAHTGKTEALHSQDDVDNLLAEFGF